MHRSFGKLAGLAAGPGGRCVGTERVYAKAINAPNAFPSRRHVDGE
jgi:hypothetical protein